MRPNRLAKKRNHQQRSVKPTSILMKKVRDPVYLEVIPFVNFPTEQWRAMLMIRENTTSR